MRTSLYCLILALFATTIATTVDGMSPPDGVSTDTVMLDDSEPQGNHTQQLTRRTTGEGGNVILFNGSPFSLSLIHAHSYQMNAWNYPSSIPPWTGVSVYVEFDTTIGHTDTDDAGEARYQITATGETFEIQARVPHSGSRNIQVSFTNFSSVGLPAGSLVQLGWQWNSNVNFAIAGVYGNWISTGSPSDWMHRSLHLLRNVPLRRFSMPGSHDAGMSSLTIGGTAGVDSCNTVTQTVPIGQQLVAGARYFDIRPVIASGQYYTGHYSSSSVGWLGGNGQSISSIVSDINGFTATNAELIVLNLGSGLQTDAGYRSFTQDEWTGLFNVLRGLNNVVTTVRGVTPANVSADITTFTVGDFIGSGRAAVVLVMQSQTSPTMPNSWSYNQFGDIYNNYSNTEDANGMANDQLGKMESQYSQGMYFLLSWTNTLNQAHSIGCGLVGEGPATPSILDLARTANANLFTSSLVSNLQDNGYPAPVIPNVILTDDVNNHRGPISLAVLSMAVTWRSGAACYNTDGTLGLYPCS